jgi:riboflavin kinase/FMN adenylyltransferase
MRQLKSLDGLDLDSSWLSIGTFDGVHLGHQAIIQKLIGGARQQNLPAVVLTFFPHPAMVLNKRDQANFLTSPEERAALLGSLGVDIVITYPFSIEVSRLSAEDFVDLLYQRLHFEELVVGYDFALGKGREGNVQKLTEIGERGGFQVQAIQAIRYKGEIVSSSRIREAIVQGRMGDATELLGRRFSLSGEVVPGDGRGRVINIPTANLAIWPEKAIPKVGVYVCVARVDNLERGAVTNIGVRPTFENSAVPVRVETHLLDYDGDLYGKMVELEFVDRIRDEMRFNGVEELVGQIHRDIDKAEATLASL